MCSKVTISNMKLSLGGTTLGKGIGGYSGMFASYRNSVLYNEVKLTVR